jgi:hypothetical protein
MIFVRRDASSVPGELLEKAERAQRELESLPPEERRDYIKKHAAVWQQFGQYLSKMSYGKCWYSESPDPQSFFDVDHFRPKLEARRSETEIDKPGYEWLAFSWDNFRYAASCSNRLSQNHDTGIVDGKSSWFPLLEGSIKASWDNRCEQDEKPVLLDPTRRGDVDLIDVHADGRMVASFVALGRNEMRVKRSCELYGLNLPRIKRARLKVMREVRGLVGAFLKTRGVAIHPAIPDGVADGLPVADLVEMIRDKTRGASPYARAARAVLFELGYPQLCAAPEDTPDESSEAA